MKFDILHNFISPVTGRILVDSLPNLSSGKVWIGDDSSPSRPVEGDPPQGPQGPQGPRGPSGSEDDGIGGAIRNAVIGQVVSSLIQSAIGGGGGLIGSIAGSAVGGLVVGGGLAVGNGLAGESGSYDPTVSSLVGPPGVSGVSGIKTIFMMANISFAGGRVEDIAPSPEADYDAVNAKWVWDLLNDNVEIIWR